MKKIISLSLVILIMVSFSLTAFAARPTWVDANGGFELNVVENETTVDVTGVLKGNMNLTTFQFAFAYNSAKLTVVTGVTADTGFDSVLGSPANVMYKAITGWGTPTINTGAVNATYTYNTAAQGWPGFRYANTKSVTTTATNFAASTSTTVFKMKFNKSSDIVASDIAVLMLGIQGPKAGNGETATNGGVASANYSDTTPTYNEIYTKSFTNYEAPVTGNSVTYATTGSTGGTAPTDATLYANGATVTVKDAGTLVKDRYTFDGWYDGSNKYAIGASYTMPATAVTFTPVWKAIPVENLPVVTEDVTPVASETVTFIDAVTKAPVTESKPVLTIPCKVPASITVGDIGVVEFGISLGGVRFPAKTNANTFDTLNSNGGKYIIKLVDTSGKLVGKTFQVFNYFGTSQSTAVPLTVTAN